MRRAVCFAVATCMFGMLVGCDGGGGLKEGISDKAVLNKKVETRAAPFAFNPGDSAKANADVTKNIKNAGKPAAEEPAPEK